jgi:hypothetical protein
MSYETIMFFDPRTIILTIGIIILIIIYYVVLYISDHEEILSNDYNDLSKLIEEADHISPEMQEKIRISLSNNKITWGEYRCLNNDLRRDITIQKLKKLIEKKE